MSAPDDGRLEHGRRSTLLYSIPAAIVMSMTGNALGLTNTSVTAGRG